MCKHAVSFGLYLLGYRPESEAGLETTTDFPRDAASLVPSLDPEEVIDILVAACATHPDVAALVQSAQARKGTFDDMVCAARTAVDAVLMDYDYARADRYVGSAVARPLGDMLSAADDLNPNLALAVALAGAYALDERQVHDRYGDLTQVIDEALVTAYRNKDQVTCTQQEMLAAALAGLACRTGTDSLDALFGIEYYDRTECAALLPELVGAAGLSYIRQIQSHFLNTAELARAPVSSTLVTRTRQGQLSAATTTAERCRVLLELLTP